MYKIIDGKQIEMTSEEVNAHNSWSETDAQKLQKDYDLANLRAQVARERTNAPKQEG